MTLPAGTLGIDVSEIQSRINKVNFAKLRDWTSPDGRKIRFVIARATLGTYVDPEYKRNRAEALANGFIFGAYGVLRPKDDANVRAQAKKCVETVGDLSDNELPVAMDFELEDGVPGGDGEHRAAELYSLELDNGTKRESYVYTASWFWQVIGNRVNSPLGKKPLWVAHYTKAPSPLLPNAWHRYAIWQYSGDGGERVDGITVDVDRNIFAGSETDLRLWIDHSKTFTPSTPAVLPPVREVQQRLVDLGYNLGASGQKKDGVDGDWGPKTMKALLAFQKAQGIPETGVLDSSTLSVLFPGGAAEAYPPGAESIVAPVLLSGQGK